MKVILGTMTFGDQVNHQNAESMINLFTDSDNSELDTAHHYCDGKTETMLGDLFPETKRDNLFIASKVNPWNENGLQPAQVKKQMAEILQRHRCNQIDLLYLHAPDLDTPVAQTLESCFELYQENKFNVFGLSNFAAWQVAEVVELCRHNGWMLPAVYQGMYNALTRDVERELFPCLRNYGMKFYAYNPLAGGLLTGKYQSLDALPDSGRFAANEGYQFRYWKKEYFNVLQDLQQACRSFDIKPAEAAMSWLVNHSELRDELGDGIILGVSKIEHLSENIESCQQAPLDQAIVDILDRGWEIIKPNCFKYFRP